MSHRFFILFFYIVIGCLSFAVAGYNFYFDPLVITGFSNKANRIVPDIDARLQKTNKLASYKSEYDALLIGSSRVEQFRQEDFRPLHIFNYAMPSIYPHEYTDYIDFFLKTNRNKNAVIYLGLDFYGTNSIKHDHHKTPDYYIGICSSFLSRFKSLLSIDSFKYSRKMAKKQYVKETFSYDRDSLNKITLQQSFEKSRELSDKQLEVYKNSFYGQYNYDKNYLHFLNEIKKRVGKNKLVVFTTPESNDLFKILINKKLSTHYEQWLRDIVATFGAVHNFMQPNSFSGNHNNYLDAHHLYPEKTAILVKQLTGKESDVSDDFYGSLLTSNNFDQQLDKIRKNSEILSRSQQ